MSRVALFVAGATAAFPVAQGILGYRLPSGSSLEVLGVCELRGKGIVCWDAFRRPAPALGRTVLKAVRDPKAASAFVPVPRMKNRIVVVRETNDWSKGPTLSLDWVAGRIPPRGLAYVSSTSDPNTRHSFLVTAHPVAMAASDAETFLSLTVWNGVPAVVVPARVGASFKMNGQTWTVRAVGKATPAQAKWFGPPFDRVWCVRLGIEGRAVSRSGVYPGLGKATFYADRTGKLASNAERLAWRKAHPKADSPFEMGTLSYAAPAPHTFEVYLNFDPRQIKGIAFGGTQNRSVEVGHIPLDPR